ncbi:MAG: MFS transporter [Gammaproteobacteria bacterium]|nr:MFS transporter [Gammaproteobacteria bacterium]
MEIPSPKASRWSDLLHAEHRSNITILAGGIGLGAVNTFVVSTALPSAVFDIGGLSLLSWTTTLYVVAAIVSAAIGGRFRAAVGARRAYVLAASVFGAGALLCALAPAMDWLIVGRALQGGGAGLLTGLAYALVRALFPERLWSKVFACISAMWGIAALTGPLLGGLFAGAGWWRGAFVFMALAALVFALFGWIAIKQDKALPTAERNGLPIAQLLLLAAAVFCVALAGTDVGGSMAGVLIMAGTALGAATLWVDRHGSARLFPRGAFSLTGTLSWGLWMVFLMSAANAPFFIFGPLLLQTLFAMAPLEAGYTAALASVAWTVTAIAVATLPESVERPAIVIGPLFSVVSLLGIATSISSVCLAGLLITVYFTGAAMGICWAFIGQRVMSAVAEEEGDMAGGAIPATQLMGIAFGSALAGLIANRAGFAEALNLISAKNVALSVFPAFLPASVLAGICAWLLVRRGE